MNSTDYNSIVTKLNQEIEMGNLTYLRKLKTYLDQQLFLCEEENIFLDKILQEKKEFLLQRVDEKLPSMIGLRATNGIKNAILNHGILTLHDSNYCVLGHVIQLTDLQLSAVRNMGEKRITILNHYLRQHHVSLNTVLTKEENQKLMIHAKKR